MTAPLLKSPYPYFGGKSKIAPLFWARMGQDVPNFVDPFMGSNSLLLARGEPGRCETVNDVDCYIANFWRCLSEMRDDPKNPVWREVARLVDWPVNEADLHARHRWLVDQAEFRERMKSDPFFYDARIAAWWVWGISQWIGSGWCSRPEWMGRSLPGRASRGVHSNRWKSRPNLTADALSNKRPNLKRGGTGIGSRFLDRRMPDLGGSRGASGKGIVRSGLKQSMPQLSGDGSGAGRGIFSQGISDNLLEYMEALATRMRYVRVCCGDWKRVLGRSPTECIGITAIALDPPYGGGADRDMSIYSSDGRADADTLSAEVRKWALANGNNPMLRIALFGYEGEHKMPKSWECVEWKANGGYGNQAKGKGRENARRERVWFSPHCLKPHLDLFGVAFR